jgi:hypothetical protein
LTAELGDPATMATVRFTAKKRVRTVDQATEVGFEVAALLRQTDIFRTVIAT